MSRIGMVLVALILANVSCAHASSSRAAAAGTAAEANAAAPSAIPLFYTGSPDAAALRAACQAELAKARESLDRMLAVRGARTLDNTLEPYSKAMMHADNAGSWSSLLESVHPDSAYRAAAEELTQATSKFLTEVSLNRAVYDALQAVDVSKADPATRHFVTRTLRDFRLAGVDRDDATRQRLQEIRDELVLVSQEFDRNIRNDSRTIQVTAAELLGLPQDYLDAHKPGPDGKITISIEYPDRFPVMTYATNGETRRRLQHETLNRAWPANRTVLDSLIAKRHRLATTLGYGNWADYITADKMIGSGAKAAEFIDRIATLTRDQAAKEYEVYLKRKREDDPKAAAVNRWEARYYEQLVRKRDFDYDAQEVRPYFPFEGVKRGILDVTSKLFGVTYTRIENAAVWHPSVEAYEVREGDRLLGRFFLDLHPRPGKYNHAAQFNVRTGVTGAQLPEAALVCNFAGGTPGDPGLMEHDDVLTFFHEFGHLLHTIFGGHQRWMPVSGIATEHDFVEAPSQMLEEWGQDAAVLRTFAKHHETGAPIPEELVAKMRRAKVFGRGIDTSFQVLFAAISLNIYNQEPSRVDPDSLARALETAIIPYPPMPDTHFQASFGHLNGYSAVYYTYLWSLVIAKDLFSRFDREKMLGSETATRYRRTVLEPGGTKPAQELVREFLGREFRYDAYEKYLRGEN
ncbi:MAG TPA: M3 family metallopeptidase [Candidatus Eisenbacteria bacterium]|nr:M3 family metallopeptidase [Candidatus Eisenbacteria bacterium]